jgi:hypothetical protein
MRCLRSGALCGLCGLWGFAVCFGSLPAHADVKLVLDEADKIITVRGVVGNEQGFQRSFRLRVEGCETHVRFLAFAAM